MPSPGGKGVDHIFLCPPEKASLAPPPPATFLAIVEKSKKTKNMVLKHFLCRHENVKKHLEGFGDHNLITERLIQPHVEKT